MTNVHVCCPIIRIVLSIWHCVYAVYLALCVYAVYLALCVYARWFVLSFIHLICSRMRAR